MKRKITFLLCLLVAANALMAADVKPTKNVIVS